MSSRLGLSIPCLVSLPTPNLFFHWIMSRGSSLGRSNGYFLKSSTSKVCVALSGSPGPSHGRTGNRLERLKHSLSVSSDDGDFSGKLSFPLQWEGGSSGSLVARKTMVSQASELVFLPQELLQSSPHLVVKRRGSFLQLSPINTSHVDNLNDIYITIFGPAIAKHLLLSHRVSTTGQCATC